MNRRIALFSASMRCGGAERVMINLAHGLVERGLEVDLVLAQTEGPYLSQVPARVRIVDLRARRVLRSLLPLARYLREKQPIALISATDHVNVVALWAKWFSGVSTKMVVSVHGATPSCLPRDSRTVYKLTFYIRRWFYPWADRVVAVSQCVADQLIHKGGLPSDKIAVVYNPVIVPELFHKAQEHVQHPWFHQPERPVILSVGRLVEDKDYETLVRAFTELRRRHAVRMVILGEGDQRSVLEKLIKELGVENDVSLPGFVDNPYAFMAKAAMFVLSSRFEGLPTVLIEALALGTPVVSTNCECGPAEILGGGRYGELVPVADPHALASAIERCLGKRRQTFSTKAWMNFELDTAVQNYMDIIDSLHCA